MEATFDCDHAADISEGFAWGSKEMKHGTRKALKVGCIFLAFFFMFSTLALLPQPVRAEAVTMTIPSIVAPRAVAVTPNGQFAYVLNNFRASVTVINAVTNTVLTTLYGTEDYPGDVAATDSYAYVTNFIPGDFVSVISTASNTVLATTYGVGSEPAGLAVTPDGKFVYVANAEGNSVSVIDTVHDTVGTISFASGNYPSDVAISPDGAYVYVTDYDSSLNGGSGGNAVFVISAVTNTFTEVTNLPSGATSGGLAATNQYAYVTNVASGTVMLISPNPTIGYVESVSLPTNSVPYAVAITPNEEYAYVTNSYTEPSYTAGDTVSMISTATNKLIGPTVTVGSAPDAIAIWGSSGDYAYVANLAGDSVSVMAVPLSIGESTTLLSSDGSATLDQTATTGVSVSISGSSSLPVMVSVTSEDYGSVDPSMVSVNLGNTVYYDVQIQGILDGTATITITGSGQTTMEYYNGAVWVQASDITVSGNTITGSIPVADLLGTPIAVGTPLFVSPEYAIGALGALIAMVLALVSYLMLTKYRKNPA